eukprot:TRINITY_DN7872_c0_g1_i1.p1 TRINITY_DN7872_c0_g1~~TRINITY_DN7872_c0_g1_i1.p1  ORF type:complete len:370 (-),score=74.23 TRINITY_DN7872_c0_g1_i1:20-1129(-)
MGTSGCKQCQSEEDCCSSAEAISSRPLSSHPQSSEYPGAYDKDECVAQLPVASSQGTAAPATQPEYKFEEAITEVRREQKQKYTDEDHFGKHKQEEQTKEIIRFEAKQQEVLKKGAPKQIEIAIVDAAEVKHEGKGVDETMPTGKNSKVACLLATSGTLLLLASIPAVLLLESSIAGEAVVAASVCCAFLLGLGSLRAEAMSCRVAVVMLLGGLVCAAVCITCGFIGGFKGLLLYRYGSAASDESSVPPVGVGNQIEMWKTLFFVSLSGFSLLLLGLICCCVRFGCGYCCEEVDVDPPENRNVHEPHEEVYALRTESSARSETSQIGSMGVLDEVFDFVTDTVDDVANTSQISEKPRGCIRSETRDSLE